MGDYLAFAQGLQSDRNRAVVEDVLGRISYIGQYVVNDNDRDAFRSWLRQYLTPAMTEVGWEPKAGESDEQRTLRSRLIGSLGYDAAIRRRWRGPGSSRTRLSPTLRRWIVNWQAARSAWLH